mmetsp:Transcript_14409/g.36465  ORF Transcript_14409/g.36465 Transcript_14409/m.36465 type:complete len:293 (+) Transcript_14409:372-1250(+)
MKQSTATSNHFEIAPVPAPQAAAPANAPRGPPTKAPPAAPTTVPTMTLRFHELLRAASAFLICSFRVNHSCRLIRLSISSPFTFSISRFHLSVVNSDIASSVNATFSSSALVNISCEYTPCRLRIACLRLRTACAVSGCLATSLLTSPTPQRLVKADLHLAKQDCSHSAIVTLGTVQMQVPADFHLKIHGDFDWVSPQMVSGLASVWLYTTMLCCQMRSPKNSSMTTRSSCTVLLNRPRGSTTMMASRPFGAKWPNSKSRSCTALFSIPVSLIPGVSMNSNSTPLSPRTEAS